MDDVYVGVDRAVRLALLAAFVVRPLDPGLKLGELKQLVVEQGFAPPLYDEAWQRSSRSRDAQETGVAKVEMMDLLVLRNYGQFPRQLRYDSADKVCRAFRSLNERLGVKAGKSVEMLSAQGQIAVEEIEAGLGILLLYQLAARVDGGFTCNAKDTSGYRDEEREDSSQLERGLAAMVEKVRAVLAARGGQTVQSTPPLVRFHRFLEKQGLVAMAAWWTMSSNELKAAETHLPGAATVLAASMLEAALVAIAEPAHAAGEWRQDFLTKVPPKDWKLGKLIEQAKVARTFSDADAHLAETLQDLRNRIHVGRFAASGSERFNPPFSNAHEAALAVRHLDLLVTRILGWAPISALA